LIQTYCFKSVTKPIILRVSRFFFRKEIKRKEVGEKMINVNTLPVKEFIASDNAQGLAEYSFILLFIAVVVIITLQALGGKVLDLYTSTMEKWPG
jgi:Flp pilus assembly pilin Flp